MEYIIHYIYNLHLLLKNTCLNININPIFSETEFWDYAKKNDITNLKFNLTAPNMPNLSKNLPNSIKQSIKDCNARNATIEYHAKDNLNLILDDTNPHIDGLVKYAASGCGEIKVKSKGKNLITIGNTKLKRIFEDDYIEAANHNNIEQIVVNFKGKENENKY